MEPSNWIIELCATGAHNYAAIIACILISTALAPSLAAASEARSGGDGSPAAVERHGDFVTVASWYGPGYEGRRTIVDAPKHIRLCTSRHAELSLAPSAFLPYELASLDSCPSPLP